MTEAEETAAFERRMEMTQWRAGHVLTEQDVAEVQLLFRDMEEESEQATNAFAEGQKSGRAQASSVEITALLEKIDSLYTDLFAERGLRRVYEAMWGRPAAADTLELLRDLADMAEEDAGCSRLSDRHRDAIAEARALLSSEEQRQTSGEARTGKEALDDQ